MKNRGTEKIDEFQGTAEDIQDSLSRPDSKDQQAR